MASTWEAMWSVIKKQFPDAILTSAYRAGDPGYHGKGQAIDIARPYPAESGRMLEYARWIGANFPHSTQLIHTPGPNILNGQPFTYNYQTQQDHYNHVHWAMTTPPGPVSPPPPLRDDGTFPLPAGHYFGHIDGPAESHGGYNPNERPIIKKIQQQLIRKGYVPGVTDPNSGWADSLFEDATVDAVSRFQRAEMPGTTRFGEVWSDDWQKLFSTSTTPPKVVYPMTLPSSSRNGATVIWIVLHTAEGSRRASDLYHFFNNNQNASSHVGIDASGVYDWVPRERAAWTLLNGNPISVNAEMCGFARWTRAQWLSTGTVDGCVNPREIVRNAARWVLRESKALGIPLTHIGVAGVRSRSRGVIDHDDYSDGTGNGDHWDIGENFPWDVLFADIKALNGGSAGGGGEEDDMFNDGDRKMMQAINGRVEALEKGYGKVPNGPDKDEEAWQVQHWYEMQHLLRNIASASEVRTSPAWKPEVGKGIPLIQLLNEINDRLKRLEDAHEAE